MFIMLLEKIQTASNVIMFISYWLYDNKANILRSMFLLNLLRKTLFSIVWGLLFYDWVDFSASL